jgi:hypothetical protein
MWVTLLAKLWLGVLGLDPGWVLVASGPGEGDNTVEVTVVTIVATNQDDYVDPLLECLARAVKEKEHVLRVAAGATETVGLLGAPFGTGALVAVSNLEVPRGKCLTGFRLGTITCKTMTVGTKDSFPLVDGQEACIEAKACAEDARRVCLRVKVPCCGGITYSSVCGKYFPILTGYQTRDQQRVIIAVMVRPCDED